MAMSERAAGPRTALLDCWSNARAYSSTWLGRVRVEAASKVSACTLPSSKTEKVGIGHTLRCAENGMMPTATG